MTDSLANSIEGDIVTPDHPDYSASLTRWAKNAERKAQTVVFVKSAEDVAVAISFARAKSVPVAVRGGGANPFGESSVEGGIVIDLSRHLNNVRIDAENQLAYVGGGALWKDVDAEAIKHGLAAVGAAVNHVSLYFVWLEHDTAQILSNPHLQTGVGGSVSYHCSSLPS